MSSVHPFVCRSVPLKTCYYFRELWTSRRHDDDDEARRETENGEGEPAEMSAAAAA